HYCNNGNAFFLIEVTGQVTLSIFLHKVIVEKANYPTNEGKSAFFALFLAWALPKQILKWLGQPDLEAREPVF
ncbi:hypothetical protein ACFOYZ_29865, partial [Neobacillus cucumis]|uniref:hypothetical protein n=1 Tax=Neobacillus cucumis TaxID=1740721 RepID=UPI003618C182